MQKFTAIISLILIYFTAVSQPKKNEIEWEKDRPLTWKDFKKKRDNGLHGLKALTNAGITIAFDCEGVSPTIIIHTIFNKQDSWTRTLDSDALLAHEQLHFDITELFARKLRKMILALGDPCGKDAGKIQGIYDRNFKALRKYQDRYDKESEHSLNSKKQAEWSKRVKAELRELKAYEI